MNTFIPVFAKYSNFAVALSTFSLGIFVLLKNPRKQYSFIFCIYYLSIALWAGVYFLWPFTEHSDRALFLIRLAMLFAYTIPSTFADLTSVLLERRMLRLRIISWSLSAFFVLLAFHPLMVSELKKISFFYWPVSGPMLHFQITQFIFMVVYLHVLLLKEVSKSTGLRHHQIRIFVIGSMIGFPAGLTNYLMCYGLPVPPIFNLLVCAFPITAAYAIVRYRAFGVTLSGYEKGQLETLLKVTGAIYHEVQSPLHFSLRNLKLMNSKINALPADFQFKEEIQNLAAEIEKSIVRVRNVTQNFSSYARPVKTRTDLEWVAIMPCIQEVVDQFKKIADEGVVLTIRLGPDLKEERVYGDRVFIQETLRNLLENAAKAIKKSRKEGGAILISIVQSAHYRIVLSVEDNGCGIAAADIKKVFHLRFSAWQEGGQHGKGLFLVKWYAEQMNAELDIRSELHQGTTVFMVLPGQRGQI